MRLALFITLLLALLTFGYSFIGESGVWARFSDVRSTLAEWQREGHALPDDATERLDGIVLRMRGEWRIIRGLSVATSLAAFIELVLALRKKRDDHAT
jgi:hypothetical protein